MKIGFIGIGQGCGVSSVAAAFGRYLTEQRRVQVTVCEPFRTSLYDGLGMEQRFTAKRFLSFLDRLERGDSVGGLTNIDQNINWVLRMPADRKADITWKEMLRLIYSLEGDAVLLDLSGMHQMEGAFSFQDYWELLGEMDKLAVLIDPLPSKMLPGFDLLMKLKMSQREVVYVVNKFNEGVPRRQLASFLKVKSNVFIPHLDIAKAYEAEYLCTTLYDKRTGRDVLLPVFKNLERELWSHVL